MRSLPRQPPHALDTMSTMQRTTITPGQVWLDTNGNRINYFHQQGREYFVGFRVKL